MISLRPIPILVLLTMTVLSEPTVLRGQGQPGTQSHGSPAVSIGEARSAIEQAETSWARARVSIDTGTFAKMLAPGFHAQLSDRRLTREEFMQRISKYPEGVVLTRFDNRVLTVQQEADTWVALILEKLEFEQVRGNGKKTKEYSLWVTRDGWRKFDDEWKVLFSEVVGGERWKNGQRPPIKDW